MRAVTGESSEGLVSVTASLPSLREAEPESPGIFTVPLPAGTDNSSQRIRSGTLRAPMWFLYISNT